ncbi:MAG: hypothetical protein AB7O67_04430 [Vicinamibacterales bacterium]
MTPPVRTRQRLVAGLIVVAAAVFLAAGFVWGSTPDEEEYRFSILTTLLHARAMADAAWPYWTSELGLGMPHPLGQNFVWHPLMPLLTVLRPDRWVVLLLVTHTIVGAAGVMWLGRVIGLGPAPSAVATATFLLASTTQNFVLTDFWPSGLVGWTLMPWIVGLILRLVGAPDDRARRLLACGLGLVAGLAIDNGHPGYMTVYGAPVVACVAVHWRRLLRDWRWWALATIIMLAVAGPTILQVGTEVGRFAPGLPRANYDDPLRWAGLWDLFVRPLPLGIDGGWRDAILRRGARVAFFGPPFALLAVGAVVSGLAVRRRRLDIGAAFVVSFVLLCTPGLSALKIFPATSLFRDPMILFGLLLAALVVDHLLRRGRRGLASALVVLQLAALAAAAWPFLAVTLDPQRRQPWRLFVEPGPAVRWLVANTDAGVGRIYYSVQVDRLVDSGDFIDQGLWRNTPAYHGLRVVSGVFKGVSTAPVSPDASLPYGRIESVAPLQQSAPSLRVLGLRYVVAFRDEPVAQVLEPVSSLTTPRGDLVLYRVPEAAAALVVPASVPVGEPPLLADCPTRGLLCRDFTALDAARLPGAHARTERAHGTITVRLEPQDSATVVVIGEMYRDGWRAAASGTELPVRGVAGGLIGVEVPPGIAHLQLDYAPAGRRVATAVAGAVLAMTLFVLAGSWIRPRRREEDAAPR